ncbi:MAG: DUF3352 domain-containing protein [Bacteroidales bacterium]|nr:DUF3352 domain-containing protein [Bacteroidales bacterium]
MNKKVFLISGIVIALGLIVFAIVYLFDFNKSIKSEPISAIPHEAAMIIELNYPADFIDLLKAKKGLVANFANIMQLNLNNSILHYIDSLKIIDFRADYNKKLKLIWSFHPEGANPFCQLVVIKSMVDEKDNKIAANYSSKLSGLGKINEREYKNVNLHEFKSRDSLPNLYYYVKNGLFIASFSQRLVEKSIDKLLSEMSLCDTDSSFKSVYETAGKKELANFYVDMNLFAGVLASKFADDNTNLLAYLYNFSSWVELDFNSDVTGVKFNGFSQACDSTIGFTNILQTQEPTKLRVVEALPDNTAFYLSLAFTNPDTFKDNLIAYFDQLGLKQNYLDKYSQVKSQTGLNISSLFYPLVDNEVCFAVTNNGNNEIFENSYLIINLQSQSAAELQLQGIFNTIKSNIGQSDNLLKDKLRIDDKTSLDVYVLPFEGLPEMLFGPYFNKCSGKYITCVNNFMIFANSKNSLFKIVYDILLNKTLKTSIEHNLFLDNFSEKSNMFMYFSMINGYKLLKAVFNNTYAGAFTEYQDLLYGFGNIGFQISKSNSMLYNNLVIKHSLYVGDKPKTVWESRLDTIVANKPALVINHDNNSKEIVVQDHKNNLYLLSNSGREIWKIKLDEQITSDIYQIDRYNNGRLQYLFSTKNKIHLIDRLGNYVDKYPVRLRASATAPMLLMDYNNDKNYRIIIPCSDNNVYLYDKEGNIVKGWEFESTENLITTQIFHQNVSGEDYIVFHDKFKAYFVNRKGETKNEYLTQFTFSENNSIYYDYTYSDPRFVTTDSKGILRFFYLDGNQDSLSLGKYSETHFFALQDINADGKMDYVFLDDKKLEVYNRQKKLIMSYNFEDKVDVAPIFYSFPSNQIKIGIVCYSVSKIYLINNDGTLFQGFPLFGLTPFSIGYLSTEANKFNLIVGGQENLLYNYTINED